MNTGKHRLRKPEWLRVKIRQGPECAKMREILNSCSLHTVCEEALCPNIGELHAGFKGNKLFRVQSG